VGADAAAGKAAAAPALTRPASTNSSVQLHLSHGKKRPANSHNENATTRKSTRRSAAAAFRLRRANGLADAPTDRHQVTTLSLR